VLLSRGNALLKRAPSRLSIEYCSIASINSILTPILVPLHHATVMVPLCRRWLGFPLADGQGLVVRQIVARQILFGPTRSLDKDRGEYRTGWRN